MALPQKKESVKWKNVFALVLLVFTAGLVWNAINYSDVKKYKAQYQVVVDTSTKALAKIKKESARDRLLYNYYQRQNLRLKDSCKNLTISYLNGSFKKYYDTTSTFWYVSYVTNSLSGYDVIKIKSKTFSLVESQVAIKSKDPFINVIYFNQVSERCWAEYHIK